MMKTRNVIIAVAGGLVVVLLIVGLLLGGSLLGRNYYHHGPGMMWDSRFGGDMHSLGGGIVMVLSGVLLLGLIVGGGVLLASVVTGRSAKHVEAEETPLEILKRRYARGEIDREEFERMRQVLLNEGGA
jgi:putative membrane protein